MSCFVSAIENSSYSNLDKDDAFHILLKQYKSIISETLITTFGLDSFVKDSHGGDVDTIHNVRQIGKDPNMTYKSDANKEEYDNRGDYKSYDYHHNKEYMEYNKQKTKLKKMGILRDAYTDKLLLKKYDQDHVVSAKEIHNDRGRVLSGLKGSDIANIPENLVATDPHYNRSKRDKTMDEYINSHHNEFTNEQINNMHMKDVCARKKIEFEYNIAYYTSAKFRNDLMSAATKVGVKMGLRQALGTVLSEIWFAVQDEWNAMHGEINLSKACKSIVTGIRKGGTSVNNKIGSIMAKFCDGMFAGILSSLQTTFINIFQTTCKQIVKVLRECWSTFVQAFRVFVFNPNCLSFGERLRETAKIIATGASVIVGTLVKQMIEKSPIANLPEIGRLLSDFCGLFVTGMMSCTLLYAFDNSSLVNQLVNWVDHFSYQAAINQFKEISDGLDIYAANLMNIDIIAFKKECVAYELLTKKLSKIESEEDINTLLLAHFSELERPLPWTGDFSDFMGNQNNRLVFR